MQVVLLEDELPGMNKLLAHVQAFNPEIEILAQIQSVEEGKAWFDSNQMPDLIISDIQLTDGLVFEIFEDLEKRIPIIFTTAFDNYMLKAFEFNSIYYILKPVTREEVSKALSKFLSIKEHYKPDLQELDKYVQTGSNKLKRMVAKSGTSYKGFEINDVAYFYSKHKITFVVLESGERLMLDKSLQLLEGDLDAEDFFRANRSLITSWKAVSTYRSYEKGKLAIDLSPEFDETIVISQEKASDFKSWYGKL